MSEELLPIESYYVPIPSKVFPFFDQKVLVVVTIYLHKINVSIYMDGYPIWNKSLERLKNE